MGRAKRRRGANRMDPSEERQRRKRPESPPSDSGSEDPTAGGDEPEPEKRWKSVRDRGVASDRNARFRRTMEDAHVAVDELCGPSTGFFGIYDGHGGRGAVNFVQEHLHVNFREQIDLGLTPAEVGYSGSTVAAAYLTGSGEGRMLHTANCGDARIVLCRSGKAQRLTVDHKGTDPDEVKRIQEAGGLVVLNRVSGILAVTRSLGDLKMKEYVIGEPYCEDTPLVAGDTYVVVACDGLWDVASDQEVCDVLTAPPEEGAAPPTAQTLANKLLLKALKQGTTDNESILVLAL